ncbi:MAG: hypothetical protein GX591_14175 [Planctomycetes bacterium]|nr:hypothetical protein [Planctomycetota bacterium]
MITVRCRFCSEQFDVPAESAGLPESCPECGREVHVPRSRLAPAVGPKFQAPRSAAVLRIVASLSLLACLVIGMNVIDGDMDATTFVVAAAAAVIEFAAASIIDHLALIAYRLNR